MKDFTTYLSTAPVLTLVSLTVVAGLLIEINRFFPDALIAALDSGKVLFAALDVFENEPTPSKELLSHPKIAATPHIGAATLEAQDRIGLELANLIIEQFGSFN
jgi:hypothetical protein